LPQWCEAAGCSVPPVFVAHDNELYKKSLIVKYFLMTAALTGMIGLHAAPAAGRRAEAPPTPAVLQAAFACRAVHEASLRLACFDDKMRIFEQSVVNKEMYVVSQAEASRARTSLFGLTLPRFNLFNGNEGAADEPQQIESTVASASQSFDGNWLVVLALGSKWQQTDGEQLGLSPHKGDKVTVKRTALGGFKLSIDSHPSVKVRRIL
jgi:hypothetical protein